MMCLNAFKFTTVGKRSMANKIGTEKMVNEKFKQIGLKKKIPSAVQTGTIPFLKPHEA